jgi:hypothetical protein
MVFVKSIEGNQSTQIYFDGFNNKHVRRGGTLAWRCNNPGLIRSHSDVSIRIGSIGHCGQYPVFPNIFLGRQALCSWLRLKSYFSEPLIAIARYHSPKDPEIYLANLCHLTELDKNSTPSQLSKTEFEKLVWAIEEISGGHKVSSDQSFEHIPKIIGKFSLNKGMIEYYLIADKRILTKEATIADIRAEKIDAVIVHRSDGTEYIRSRPGHIFSEIYTETEKKIELPKIQNIIREAGEYREGQAIWGFINGIINPTFMAKKNLQKMVEAVNGEQVWGMINDTGLAQAFGASDAFSMKFGMSPEIVNTAIDYIHFLIDQSEKHSEKPPIIIIAHSEGAMIAEFAVKQLKPSIQKKIQFWTFGGAGFVPDGICHPKTCNYVNQHDPIIQAVSPLDYRILTVRDQFKEKKLDYIANILAEEDMLVQGFDIGPIYKVSKEKKANEYKKRLDELANTRIIYHKKLVWNHHEFKDPEYQLKLQELIEEFYGSQ